MEQLSDLEVIEKFEQEIEQASHLILVGGMEDCLPLHRRILLFAKCWIRLPGVLARDAYYTGEEILDFMVAMQERFEQAKPDLEQQIRELEQERDAYKDSAERLERHRDKILKERDEYKSRLDRLVKLVDDTTGIAVTFP